jgi:hypothetical protein
MAVCASVSCSIRNEPSVCIRTGPRYYRSSSRTHPPPCIYIKMPATGPSPSGLITRQGMVRPGSRDGMLNAEADGSRTGLGCPVLPWNAISRYVAGPSYFLSRVTPRQGRGRKNQGKPNSYLIPTR